MPVRSGIVLPELPSFDGYMAKLNHAYVLDPFHQLLTKCHTNVLMGLRLVEKIDAFPDPTAEEKRFLCLSFGGRVEALVESKASFKRWVLLNGLGDIYKSIRTTLERLFVFKSIERSLTTSTKLNLEECEAELRIEARSLDLPQLVAKVPSLCGEQLNFQNYVESVNHARNCLEHDNGTVTRKRCNTPTKDRLLLQGPRFRITFKNEQEEVPTEFGKRGPENAALMLGAEDFQIEFALNQFIELSHKQFIDILNTCVFFRADIETKLVGKGA
jgi:hypothetical protein